MRILLAAMLLWGCTPGPQDETLTVSGSWSSISVVEDAERGVICYVYLGYGISCLEIAR